GGLIQAQAESGGRVDPRFSDDNDRVYLRRARVNVQGKFAEHFDFKSELDLAGSLGNASGLRAQATDVYVNWTKHPFARIRAGQFKSPYGFEQLYSDPVLLTPERTMASDRIAIGRQLGVQLGGDLANKRLTYSLGAFNGNGTNISNNDDEGFLTAARLSAKLLDGKTKWNIGANGFVSDDRSVSVAPELGFAGNTFAGSREAWGVDTQFSSGPFEAWAELLTARFEPNSGASRELTGAYLLGAYTLTKNIQAVARYETYDWETADTDLWTIGGNYLFKGQDLKLQLFLLHSEEDDRVMARLQAAF
ncbi:MAG: porin, partial [Thermoanaerobaculia bacterium]